MQKTPKTQKTLKRPLTLGKETEKDIFYMQKTFKRSSIFRRPSRGLLCVNDPQEVLCTQRKLKRSIIRREHSRGLLCVEDPQDVFYSKKILKRFSIPRFYSKVFYTKKTLSMYSIRKISLRELLFKEDPNEVLYTQKTLKRLSIRRGPPRGDTQYVFYKRPPNMALYVGDPQGVFCLKMILKGSSFRIRPSRRLLFVEDPQKVEDPMLFVEEQNYYM